MEVTVFLLLFLCAEAATEEFRALCPTHPVKAEEGDNVDLPCHLNHLYDLSAYTVDWKRADLNKVVVHLYRHGKDDSNPQREQYRNRTNLNHKDLSRGILNLQISSVQLSDSGPYKCNVPKLMVNCVTTLSVVKKHQNTTKTPAVEEETQPDEKTVDVGAIAGVCCPLFLAFIASGVLVKVLKNQNCREKLWGRKEQQTEMVANGSEKEKLNSQTAEGAENLESLAENGLRNIVTSEV